MSASARIILFKTHPVNLTNLLIALICNNEYHHAYKACQYELNGKFLTVCPGEFAKSFLGNLRHIDWQQQILTLQQHFESAKKLNQTVIFGNHKSDQIKFLKNKFSKILTVGVCYDQDLYSLLIKNLAEYHVHCLRQGLVTANHVDKKNLTNLSYSEMVDYYIMAFDQMQLIPVSSNDQFDYNISVNDFFDLSKIQKHLENIGITVSSTTKTFYNTWYLNFV